MPALSEHKTEKVRGLVEAAPDRLLEQLQAALAALPADAALSAVIRVVDGESRDRKLRNMVLEPIVALCGDGDDAFPSAALSHLWRGLKGVAPEGVRQAQSMMFDYRPGETSPETFDRLVQAAAHALRKGAEPEFAAAARACEAARPGAAAALAAGLDLSPIMRRALANLDHWIANPTEESKASARLAYRDATAVASDAGPRFFEMLAPHVDPPWMMLRVISAIMDRPAERYLAESEMAGFAERVLDDIDEAMAVIGRLDTAAGVQGAREAARLVEAVTLQAAELESCIELSRESGWGKRLVEQRRNLAAVVEGRLRETEKAIAAALPTTQATIRKLRRTVPRLSTPPQSAATDRAMTLLTFVHEIRFTASYGGFAAAHGKMLETQGDLLDHYVEEVLELARGGHADNPEAACAYLLLVADFVSLVRDEKAAELVRRRAATLRTAA